MKSTVLTLLQINEIKRREILEIINCTSHNLNNEVELLEIINNIGIGNKDLKNLKLDHIKRASYKSDEIIYKSNEKGIKYVDILSDNYPKKLLNLKRCPLILYYKGNYNTLLNNRIINIIGSREASPKGLKMAFKLGYIFGKDGYSVASGLAYGCDTQVHRGCLKSNGETIAVLPSSIDNIYPNKNKDLAEEIVDKNGCLVSEYPVESKINKYSFIKRNEIQEQISDLCIVCEASIKSGSMYTANLFKKNNKTLGCVKMNRDGNNLLLKDKGCIKIENTIDITKLEKEIFNRNINTLLVKEKTIYEQLKMNI